MYEGVSYINLGLAGIFIGFVIIAFIPPKVIDLDVYIKTIISYQSSLNNMVKALNLEGNPVFIPSYEDLPNGGIFIPKYKNFSINLGMFDEETFLVNGGGILITPPIGYRFIEDFEDYSDIKLKETDLGLAISVASSVLKIFGLVEGIDFEEKNESIKIIVENLKVQYNGYKIPCPIISSIVYLVSLSLNQLIYIENIKKEENYIEINLKKLGSVDEHLW
ncbi:hypothetical protein [Methanotorris formicicus]|uniref:DUF7982 domain-containing protein n=1 Tax=Methanotorris formicicus Mc-S-70 TaxID=647171 RepID=H1KXE1_9EURY|nr:hypothetical protein [Methanotorris formicicus]EHP88353.1 hypothetical protein MetfoDRAFT_0464 [Methanotorris formicicus Mc-S-70]